MRIWIPFALLQGCALGASGPYTGQVDGLDAAVGLVLDSGQGRLYLGGGQHTHDSHTRWFDIATEQRGFVGLSDGWTVTADYLAGGFSGTVTDPSGSSWAFSAASPLSEVDGLYSAEVGGCLAGGVVWGGGADFQGVVCLPSGITAPLQPEGELDLHDGALWVRAGDGEPFEMWPVLP